MEGLHKGMIYSQGKWNKISFDMDNNIVYYLDRVLNNFSHNEIMELIDAKKHINKLLLSDGVKPLQYMNKFRLC